MTRKLLGLIMVLVTLGLMAGGTTASAMPGIELWESYSAGTDAAYEIQSHEWYAQTFTVSPESHSVNEIRIFGYRQGEPGTITVSLRNTDGSGLPYGPDLASGTFNGDVVTNSTDGAWCAVIVTETNLDYGEVYAVVIRAEAGDGDNSFHIKVDETTPTYTGGSAIESANSGVTWTADTDTDAYFQIYGKALLEVTTAKVFSGYIENGDLLFVLQYLNTYVPYYPNREASRYFWIQLRNTDDVVIAQTVCQEWGYKPGSIYLNADAADGLTFGDTYGVYLVGDMSEEPVVYYTITASDWQGSDLTLLDSWVITTARVLADYYDVDMTTTSGTEEILNEQGGVIFATGIPRLASVRPGLFASSIYAPGYDAVTPTGAYEEATTWQAVVGPQVANLLDSVGAIVGLEDGRHVGAALLVALYFGLCILIVSRKGDVLIGAALGIPIMVAGSWLHVIDIVFIMVIASIGIFFTMYRFWWART